jgi:uncharacterized membrane protein YhaH (DUF805 family)
MTDSQRPDPEPANPLAILSYRGRLGRGAYFSGLLIEVLLILVGLLVFAQAMNPTGGGGGPALLLVFIPIVVWIHSVIVAKRMRDAGKRSSDALLFAAAPFVVLGGTFAFMWDSTSNQKIDDSVATFLLAAAVALVLMALPGMLPPKRDEAATS